MGLKDWFKGRKETPAAVTVIEASIQPSLVTDSEITSDINLERAAEECRKLMTRNPTARRIIRLDIDYTVGSSVAFQVELPDGEETKQEAMQEALTRWAGICRINSRFWQDLFRRFLVDGEIGLKFVPGPQSTMRPVMMTTVGLEAKIDKDSGDVVALTKSEGGKARRFTVINSMTLDPTPGDPNDNILYFRHDAAGADEGQIRGCPELVPLVTRLQYEDEVTKLEVQRAKSMLRYFWQVIVHGASGAELEDLQRKYAQAPATGTVRYTNELTEFKGVTPDLGSYETSRVLQDVRVSLAAGAGVPVHFLGEGGDANLATATAMNTPAHRHFERLQGEFADMVDLLLRTVLERFLGFEASQDLAFDLTLPEMDAEDQVSATQTLVQATAAVQSMVDGDFITQAAGQRMLSMIIEQTLGLELDDEDLPEEVEEDPYAQNPPPVPPQFDQSAEEPPPEEE